MPAVKVESLLWRLDDTLVQGLQRPYYSLSGWKISCCSQNSGAEYITSFTKSNEQCLDDTYAL